MNGKPLRVLIVEDSADDAELVELELRKNGYEPTVLRVENERFMREALETSDWDVIIADYSVPGFGAVPALRLLTETGRDIPFIIVSGSINDETAVAAMRAGAHDYLLKDNIARLVPAIERETQEAKIRRQKNAAEAALWESSERLRATFDYAAVGIIEIDPQGRIVAVNERVCDILRYERAELLNKSIRDITFPEDLDQTTSINAKIMDGSAETLAYEKRYVASSGSPVWVHVTVSSVRDTAGHVIRVIATVEDITLRKRAELELLESKAVAERSLAQLHMTLDAMTEGLYIMDQEGRPILVNRALQVMFGLDPTQRLLEHQKHFQIFELQGEQLPLDRWPARRVLRGELLRRCELRVVRTDTKKEWIVSYNGASVTDSNGDVIMAVLSVEDISTAKQTQQALIRSEKLAATGRLAATIAHEINNPLESMANVVYLMRDLVNAEGREYLDIINTQIHTLSRIATQTLKFHRENGRPAEYSLRTLVSELLEFFRLKAVKHGVAIASRIETEGKMFGFVGEIRQVISNLIINAIEATPNGGAVTVHLYESLDWRTDRRGYRLTVADNGTGVDREHRERIFEPFFTTKGEKGTGLGLWVSMGIVDRAGGTMRVWSTQRRNCSGTCFTIFLPSGQAMMADSGRRRYERKLGGEAAD